MSFKDGDRVIATREIVEPASGDHPEFLLAKKGEVLVIVDASFECKHPWVVCRERDNNRRLFSVDSDEIKAKEG